MNRRNRSICRQSPTRPEPFLKYLKPGALALLRDSRISARSHRILSLSQIPAPHRSTSPSNDGQPQVSMIDGFPCFAGRIYGPRCLQRKKLLAAKTVLVLNSDVPGLSNDSPDPIVDMYSSDVIAAH